MLHNSESGRLLTNGSQIIDAVTYRVFRMSGYDLDTDGYNLVTIFDYILSLFGSQNIVRNPSVIF